MRTAFPLLAGAALVAGCASLPPLEGRVPSTAHADTAATRLGGTAATLAAPHSGKSGFFAMPGSADAFAARMLLAEAAERSIDAQYYIWHADQTGLMLLDALVRAARRGVRVRLLLDDLGSAGIDPLLAALGAERNLEVRLYNPVAQRGLPWLEYVMEFGRLNRRMHNKAFVADGAAAVVGGRNIGNEYFGAGDEVPFKDLDVVVIGPTVRAVADNFDRYWNSASAYPAVLLAGPAPADAAAYLDARFSAARADPVSLAYLATVRTTPLVTDLLGRRLVLEWADARLLSDDPVKTLGATTQGEALLLGQLLDGGRRPRATLDMISPYFVPGERGTAALEELARAGVRVRVLTNSWAVTDVGPVHAGYAKRRCRLARAGVRLYELKPEPEAERNRSRDGVGSGSSGARLHAKTYAGDERRIFVGSFNFDPRSALLNTEMGVLIDSPVLARRLASVFDDTIPARAYEVRAQAGDGCIEWIERTAAGEVRHATEPHTSWGRRAWLAFLGTLPLDWLL